MSPAVMMYATVSPIVCFGALICYKRDMGALLWLNAETLKERPPPSLTDL